ncbi:MAG: glycosyltransferase [Leptolinea sp.]|nr:glycosyltransferase [Leptolinea sp.]
MDDKKTILILTADAGFGHRSAALAVKDALQELAGDQCDVHLVNPLEDRRTPFFLRDSQADYDKIIKEAPELYRMGYDMSDNPIPSAIAGSALMVLLYEVMHDLVATFKPDAIVTTYPLYQTALEAVFTIDRVLVPLFTVVTDLSTVHRIWFNRAADACLVPNAVVRNQAISNNLKPENIIETGIPVSMELVKETRSKIQIRRELGWDPDRLTLLAVGSKRVDRLIDIVNTINHSGYPVQIAVAGGNDEALFAKLQAIEWHIPAFLYEYVNNMPVMMHAADAVICKAGGLIVTESLACGLPILLIDVLPGQETGNAQVVIDGGAGDMAVNPLEALETLSHWMKNDRALLKERAENSRKLGKPYAARDVANIVWQGALRGPVDRRKRRLSGRTTLLELLQHYHPPIMDRLTDISQWRDSD